LVGDMQMLDLNIKDVSKPITNSDGIMRAILFKNGVQCVAFQSWYGYESDPKYWEIFYATEVK